MNELKASARKQHAVRLVLAAGIFASIATSSARPPAWSIEAQASVSAEPGDRGARVHARLHMQGAAIQFESGGEIMPRMGVSWTVTALAPTGGMQDARVVSASATVSGVEVAEANAPAVLCRDNALVPVDAGAGPALLSQRLIVACQADACDETLDLEVDLVMADGTTGPVDLLFGATVDGGGDRDGDATWILEVMEAPTPPAVPLCP